MFQRIDPLTWILVNKQGLLVYEIVILLVGLRYLPCYEGNSAFQLLYISEEQQFGVDELHSRAKYVCDVWS